MFSPVTTDGATSSVSKIRPEVPEQTLPSRKNQDRETSQDTTPPITTGTLLMHVKINSR